ncbi:hypothetical protein [Marinococcus halotolerans]|uniref:hypothetical protein n=1 Tax=Marinococcus halotolerans TaxID=301092 RepID=UPI0003B775B1|nr:hypothetical protein [Marinococcus halotolerans]
MIFHKPYSYWSVVTSLLGIAFLGLTYVIAPDIPQGFTLFVINILVISAAVFILIGVLSSIAAIVNKEPGIKKYLGIFIPSTIILYIVLVPLIMGLLFGINNNP